MIKAISNAWKIPELRKKIIFTLLILLVYRVGCYIPVPGVDVAYIQSQVGTYSILGFLNMFSGGALENMTLFALGITPYINASIIMNLLCVAIPALEKISKGEDGAKKIQNITRYVGVGLGLVQAIAIILGMGGDAVPSGSIFDYITIILCLTAGAAVVMWLGEKINDDGIGNGISLIIFISIISRIPSTLITLIANVSAGAVGWWAIPAVIAFVLIILFAITYVDMGERRIPVQYAKKVVGRKMYGGQSTYIPMKVNQSGVMPLIFASTFLQFPAVIGQFWGEDAGFNVWWNTHMAPGSVWYMLILLLLIFFFAYFYSQIAFNPIDVSKNMQQNGGFLPGIRPGKPTSDYLAKVLSRVTIFGAIFLALVAAVPTLLTQFTSVSAFSAFGSTSVLIMVSVALETSKALESQIMMRHYKGFLK